MCNIHGSEIIFLFSGSIHVQEAYKRILKGSDVVYNTQNYWVFELRLSSGILKTTKHNVSETGSVSETFCFLVFRMLDDGQNPKKTSNSKKLTNSSCNVNE
jgi:hypothetical protein